MSVWFIRLEFHACPFCCTCDDSMVTSISKCHYMRSIEVLMQPSLIGPCHCCYSGDYIATLINEHCYEISIKVRTQPSSINPLRCLLRYRSMNIATEDPLKYVLNLLIVVALDRLWVELLHCFCFHKKSPLWLSYIHWVPRHSCIFLTYIPLDIMYLIPFQNFQECPFLASTLHLVHFLYKLLLL